MLSPVQVQRASAGQLRVKASSGASVSDSSTAARSPSPSPPSIRSASDLAPARAGGAEDEIDEGFFSHVEVTTKDTKHPKGKLLQTPRNRLIRFHRYSRM
jgi:hypothetical protein